MVYFHKVDQINLEFYGTAESFHEKDLINSSGSLNLTFAKPSLTGSYLVDNELHKIIDFFIRDYIDEWYKAEISSKEEFIKILRSKIYTGIRYVNSRYNYTYIYRYVIDLNIKNITYSLKDTDWENFFTYLSHNLVVQMRLFKKAKEKHNQMKSTSTSLSSLSSNDENISQSAEFSSSNSNHHHHNNGSHHLVEIFFDLEAEIEKVICRDQVSTDLNDIDQNEHSKSGLNFPVIL